MKGNPIVFFSPPSFRPAQNVSQSRSRKTVDRLDELIDHVPSGVEVRGTIVRLLQDIDEDLKNLPSEVFSSPPPPPPSLPLPV